MCGLVSRILTNNSLANGNSMENCGRDFEYMSTDTWSILPFFFEKLGGLFARIITWLGFLKVTFVVVLSEAENTSKSTF